MQTLVNRFLKSRILPLACSLVLFAGSIAAAGSILWNARIREVLPMTGELKMSPEEFAQQGDSRETIIAFLPLSGFSSRELSALQPGRDITLGFSGQGSEQKSIAGIVLRIEQQAEERLVMSFDNNNAAALSSLTAKAGAVQITLSVRNKRLLLAALEKI